MNNILKAWNAGFVRRWHTQPHLVDTDDRNNGHQHRCTIFLLLFWPDSTRDSIIDTIIHDQGEADIGDIARPAKHAHSEIREMVAGIEHASIIKQGFQYPSITKEELQRRKFVDLLDAYVWMLRHKYNLKDRFEWNQQSTTLFNQSKELGIKQEYSDFMKEALDYYK